MIRLPAIAADIRALFATRGAEPADVAIVQPADPFLDIAGEDLRRRIFLTESETGEQLCLRPEFTIPVCLDHIASKADTPRRYSYLGEVFRQRRDGRPEFFQAGIEDLGDTNAAEADARSVGDAYALLHKVLPGQQLAVTLGDQALFEAVLGALGLPRGWRMRLARAFGSTAMLDAALADLGSQSRTKALAGPAALLVAGGDEAALVEHVTQGMHTAGIPLTAGRTPEEIARRLVEKAELASVQLSPAAFDALRCFLAIRVPVEQATAKLEAFASEAGLSLGKALAGFSARLEALRSEAVPLDEVTYDAAFGRPLDYYTGLVFEIAGPGADRPLAGGGRYDRLLTMLGARQPIPGVGFSVWLDRIDALRGAQ
ncbi:MAG: ATP phosphoribosyltransferase regulatory subunit [Mesorhizobium sp.]